VWTDVVWFGTRLQHISGKIPLLFSAREILYPEGSIRVRKFEWRLFTLYRVISQKLLQSPSWKTFDRWLSYLFWYIFFIIFQMSSQNTRRISYNKNEEACMLDTVTLSFMNWRFLYTVINFVFFAARCFSSPDWLPEIRQCDVSIYVLRILSRWAVKGPHMTLLTSHPLLNPLIYSPLYQHINLLSIPIKISHFINLLVSELIKDFIS
jgi:hypothetical protein